MQTLFPRLRSILLSAWLFLPVMAMAGPIAYDSFQTTTTGTGGTYSSTVGGTGSLFGQNPTVGNGGFNGAWSNGGGSTTGDMRAETSGLTHSLLQGTAQAGDIYPTQNTVLRVVTRGFDSTVNSVISGQESSSGEIWFSGLVASAQAPNPSNPILFGLSANTMYNLAPSTGVMFGVDDGAICLFVNGVQVGGTGFSITTGITYLVTAKIDFTAGGTLNDSVTLEIYSPTATAGSPTATLSASGLTINSAGLGYLSLARPGSTNYADNASTPRFDEFRLGLTQADVMAIPEPSSLGLLGMAFGALWLARRRRA